MSVQQVDVLVEQAREVFIADPLLAPETAVFVAIRRSPVVTPVYHEAAGDAATHAHRTTGEQR